jgi:biopolymer transport protein ExbD
MAIISGSNDGGMMSEINVTPLVDVMLVLLTVFIVTAPLLMNAVPVNLPKASAKISITQLKTARISVTDQGEVYFNETKLPIGQLETTLKQANKSEDFSIEILADEKVAYGTVAKVMAAIQRAGISKFTFVMMPDPSRKGA